MQSPGRAHPLNSPTVPAGPHQLGRVVGGVTPLGLNRLNIMAEALLFVSSPWTPDPCQPAVRVAGTTQQCSRVFNKWRTTLLDQCHCADATPFKTVPCHRGGRNDAPLQHFGLHHELAGEFVVQILFHSWQCTVLRSLEVCIL